MIEYLTSYEAILEHVVEIRVGPKTSGISSRYERTITVRTKQGDILKLALRADEEAQLEFIDDPDPWITPKVYKGKSMQEEEMDENE